MITALHILFALSLALILYTYAGYPLLIALLARLRPRAWQKSPWPVTTHPPVSIVLAVHNSSALVPAQIVHLLSLPSHLVGQVIAVSDGSTDSTPALLQSLAAQNPRLTPVIVPAHSGKATALNHGVAAATGEILLFIDIRPRVEPASLDALLTSFADPSVGCVAGELLLVTAGHDATASAVSGLYWRYEQWMRNCEAAFDSPTGVYGGFYAMRRALFTPFPPGVILDDMFQPLSVIRQGYRSVLDRDAIVTDRWPATSAGEFSRKVRTLAGNFQLLQLAPWLLTPANRVLFQLVSHKLLRLVVPWAFVLLLLSSAILGLHSAFFAAFTALQFFTYTFALLSLRVRIPILHRIGAPLSALLVLNAAAVKGLHTFLFTRGPLWKTWKPTPVPTSNPGATRPRTSSKLSAPGS